APQQKGGPAVSSPRVAMPEGPIAQDWPRAAMPTVSAPVIADGVVLVSVTHERRLVAFNVATGGQRWSLPLAARLEYPPTVYRGLVFMGGNDGTVSCLRLKDGVLVWRFLAAPGRRRIVFAGQVESAWPVPGVLIHEDKAYVTAGRHNQLDGGIHVWCLDPATGKILGRAVLDGRLSNQPPMNRPFAIDFEGRSNDILSLDRYGRAIHMRDIAIDPKSWDWLHLCAFGDALSPKGNRSLGRLDACAGFTRDELSKLFTRPIENHYSLSNPEEIKYGGAGLGIKFNFNNLGEQVSGSAMAIGRDRLVVGGRGGGLVSAPLDAGGMPIPVPKEAKGENREQEVRRPLTKHYRTGGSIALTPDRVVVAEPAMAGGNPHPPAALWLLTADGSELAKIDLPADPIPGNLAIAGTDIVVGTGDGGIHCFSTRE
ncbi:MAG: PQQ-binding-like beta-propeller repeat protein, partial [Tepidisphaeraceae bacterium]